MVHLPSELWLQILSYTDDPKTLWRSLRPANRQLKACVQQHFRDAVLPKLTLSLAFGLPCYDARNPLKGKALFTFSHLQSGEMETVVCCPFRVEPKYNDEQFMIRWDRLTESHRSGLPRDLEWTMSFAGSEDQGIKEIEVNLMEPRPFSGGCGKKENGVAFEWMGTLTRYFR